MEIKFIGQGYNLEVGTSVASEIIDALRNKDYTTFECLVAFASISGVSALKEHIIASKGHISQHKVIVGIDSEGTSKEALEGLLAWDVDAYVYYFNSNRGLKPIFHPKIYMFKGTDKCEIIIGSNNLTTYGLTGNVEGSVSIKYDIDDENNDQLADQIEGYYGGLLNLTDVNLKRITPELIQMLHETGDLPSDERRAERHERVRANDNQEEGNEGDQHPDLGDIFEIKQIQKPPIDFRPTPRPVRPARANVAEGIEIGGEEEADDIDQDNWEITNDSEVLIAEIGGPSRWKQISFAKSNFETFFEIPIIVGVNWNVRLKYFTDQGEIEDAIENCHAIVKASSNYNLEPSKVSECRVTYNRMNKPIIFFIKINRTNFIYHFETHGTNNYSELDNALNMGNGVIRRRRLTLETLKRECPSLNL